MKVIYRNDWMQIFQKGEQYIIQYNSGDLINSIKEIEVSRSEALKAQENDQSAYEVIIASQNKEERTKQRPIKY